MSKPFQLLKTFTKNELTNFQKLLDSGFIGPVDRLSKLLKFLKKQPLLHESFTPVLESLTYQNLFGDKDVGEILNDVQSKKINRVMNDLLKAAEKYLMFEQIKNTDKYNASILFPELINRKQQDLCSMRIKAAEKKLDKVEKKGVEYYNQYYQIHEVKANLLYINKVLEKEDNYGKLQEYLDIKYLLQKLQYHLAKITLQRRYTDKTFNLKPFKALQNLLKQPEYQLNPLVELYQLNIQLVENEEELTFLALLKLLKEKQDIIPENFLKPFYTNLTNHCTYQLTKGDLKYFNYMFEINKDMHEAKLFVKNNNIDAGLLKNIITIACRVKEFEWAINQLLYYINYIPKEIKQSVFEYNNGIVAFNQKKYEEAQIHFNKVGKIDDTHDLDLRIVQLQCYYETDATYEAGTQQIVDSLKMYIHQTKKLTKRQKLPYSNFINIFNKLYKFKDLPDKRSKKNEITKKLPKIKEYLSQFNSIREKQWLIENINKLESEL